MKKFILPVIAVLLTPLVIAETKPNIIFLEVQTPNMDKLGADGIIFDKHYNTTSICTASRANVMTGMYEYKTGTNFEHGNMTKEIWSKSYPILLRESGYITGFAGKFGFKIDGHGYDAGEYFDKWGGANHPQSDYNTAKNPSMKKYAEEYPHSTLSYGAFSQDFIKEAVAQQKPFCLSISFKAPHRPALPDPKFDHIYKGHKFTKPANYGRENGAHLSEQSKQGRQYRRFTEWEPGHNYDKNYDEVMATYYQQVYAIDVALGMVRKELEAQGVADNTVIIYTSDNGFICGSHGYGSKVLPMEESARVPLMIFDPRSPSAGQGKRSSAVTGNIDFAPTMLELAGLPIPPNVDGVSLIPILENPEVKVRDHLAFLNMFGPSPTQSLTMVTEDWKYTYWWYGDDTMKPVEELFHLKSDPYEMNNLATSQQAVDMLTRMQILYDKQLQHWTTEGTKTNKYPQYTTLFSRQIPWNQKTINVKPSKKKKLKKSK